MLFCILSHSLLADGFLGGRRACPPNGFRAAGGRFLSRARSALGLALSLRSRGGPGTSWACPGPLSSPGFRRPEPNQANDANHGDDYENIHITNFYLTAVFGGPGPQRGRPGL